MSKYTTELRFICETLIGLRSSTVNVEDVIKEVRPIIFSFEYPIFDADYKPTLEEKILSHYYFREIGAETYGLWKFYLQRKMREIMPLYNQYYQSALIEFNPMEDTKLERAYNLKKNDKTNNTRTIDENVNYNRDAEGSSTVNQNVKQDGDNLSKFTDTPQGGLDGIISSNYLTTAQQDIINQTTVTGTNTNYNDNIDDKTVRNNTDILNGAFTANDKYLEKLTGKSSGKGFSIMLNEFRETFLNIDMMVIQELEPLFMQLW